MTIPGPRRFRTTKIGVSENKKNCILENLRVFLIHVLSHFLEITSPVRVRFGDDWTMNSRSAIFVCFFFSGGGGFGAGFLAVLLSSLVL